MNENRSANHTAVARAVELTLISVNGRSVGTVLKDAVFDKRLAFLVTTILSIMALGFILASLGLRGATLAALLTIACYGVGSSVIATICWDAVTSTVRERNKGVLARRLCANWLPTVNKAQFLRYQIPDRDVWSAAADIFAREAEVLRQWSAFSTAIVGLGLALYLAPAANSTLQSPIDVIREFPSFAARGLSFDAQTIRFLSGALLLGSLVGSICLQHRIATLLRAKLLAEDTLASNEPETSDDKCSQERSCEQAGRNQLL